LAVPPRRRLCLGGPGKLDKERRRINKVVPAPRVAIVALTAFTVVAAINVPDVGDERELPDSLPT
jgi:hypothetical protein